MKSAQRNIASLCLSALFALAFLSVSSASEEIKIGTLKSLGAGPLFIAQEKGYFAAEGLDSKILIFDSAQPVAVAATSRDIDIAVTAFTGGMFSLASQGALRVIAAYGANVPGFKFDALVVSNHAWQNGLRSFKDFPGHAYGVSQIGAPPHYELALLGEKYHFDLKSMRIVPLQSLANVASALTGGQIDASSLVGAFAIPLIDRGDVKLLGWTGDEVPYQLGAVFTSTKTAAEKPETIAKFLRAYRKGVREYHDAVTGPDGKRADGPNIDEVAAVLAKYTGLTVAQVKQGAVYIDRDARIDEDDVMHQIDWFLKEGLIKSPVDRDTFFDKRFVVPLPKS